MELKEIIGQHGNSVARVFAQLGVTSPVTTKDVLLTTVLYKEKFINALVTEIENEPDDYDNFLGLGKKNKAKRVANRAKRKEKRQDRRQTRQANRSERQANRAQDNDTDDSQELDPETRQTNLPEVSVTASKKARGSKVGSVLSDILGLVGQGLGVYAGIKAGQQQGTAAGSEPLPEAEKKAKQKQSYFLIGGIILVIILLVALFAGKAKK